ncbi:uncharacterized protein LOC143180394 [Calliopsis andreniformis]|uniref:uncharacterized protein LOC143180394 n=1 Tax=Calliopsis andreniformis TaxID=337506 RepID=UPI003FCE6E41
MAVASGALYNARTAVQSFMSSNTYYGYVPPYRNESQFSTVLEHANVESPVFDPCSYDTAMETDDDGCDYSIASSYLNNNSVILEASGQNRLGTNEKQQQCPQLAVHSEADTLRRRNRKRCNGDLSPTSDQKKFREGGGNKHAHHDRGNAEDHGLATVSYESDLLHIKMFKDTTLKETSIVNGGCFWAAGNHNQLNNSDYKCLSSSTGCKSIENSTEYEKILFETHGCSIYHLHRLQAYDGNTETEF